MAGKGLGPQPPKGLGAPRVKSGPSARPAAKATRSAAKQAIPDAVANRMARRIAIASGIPSLLGMGVFVLSYWLVSRQIMDVPTGVTLVASGGFFLLGVLGLSYGVLSASWEPEPGSLFGGEQIGVNISRLRQSIKAMRSGGPQG